MPQSIQALRERRNAQAKEARNLLDQNPGANWKAEHQTKYDEIVAEIGRVDDEIRREQTVMDITADQQVTNLPGKKGAREGETALNVVHQKWLRGGDAALNADDWAVVRNTMSTTTDSEGGYTVQTEVASTVLDAVKAYGGIRDVATVIRTAGGNPMQWPTSDGTSEEGEIIAQNQPATSADISFGTNGLPVYKFGSKIITVPFELLQDSSVDIEAFVNTRVGHRLGRITNRKGTVGTGTDEPMGLATASTAGKTGTTGQTLIVIYDDLVDLEHSVDPEYRKSAGWMLADSSLKVVRKIKDGNNRPIFVPGYDEGMPHGAPDEIFGKPITVNQHMPVMAANAKSILFGDFSKYVVRDVMQVTLFRFTDSAYVSKGQVGFLAWMRSGGNYMDVGGAVKHYANSAT